MLDAISYLFSLEQFGIKLGLGNIQTILDALGHPERAFASVHVAGTNGKGSVTAMVDAVLREAGHRSARYTSPHLVDLRERFVIDGRPVGETALREAAGCVRDVIAAERAAGRLPVEPTFFEATTAVAFELFARARVDIAVVEVGLGGRLDSTNVIAPVACAITAIDFDHERHLGSTVREIAAEKAGIVKPGVPVVVGAQPHAEALATVAQTAADRGARLIHAPDGVAVESLRLRPDTTFCLRTPLRDYGVVHLALRGAHQVANAIVALRVLEILDAAGVGVTAAACLRGLAAVQWPGRLDSRTFEDGREVILDAAHNPAGAAALASYLSELEGAKPALVFAALRNKDIDGMLRALLPSVGALVVTKLSSVRSADPVAVAGLARAIAPALPTRAVQSPRGAIDAAWERSPRVVVASSIFLLGEVMQELGA